MLNVYLLRHGETTYNADGNRYCGRTDAELTPKGIKQAKTVSEFLKDIKFDAVYSSPLKRAKETAHLVSGGQEIITDERLIEMDFGQWEGKTRQNFTTENPELWSRWSKDPETTKAGGTGESAGDLLKRVQSFYSDLRTKHSEGNVLVVAHNGVNRFFLANELGMPLKNYRKIVQENSAITLIGYDEDGFSLRKLNSKG